MTQPDTLLLFTCPACGEELFADTPGKTNCPHCASRFIVEETTPDDPPQDVAEALARLGLPPTSTFAQARERYHHLIAQCHPDVSPDTTPTHTAANLNTAWAVVKGWWVS